MVNSGLKTCVPIGRLQIGYCAGKPCVIIPSRGSSLARDRVFEPRSGIQVQKKQKCFFPAHS